MGLRFLLFNVAQRVIARGVGARRLFELKIGLGQFRHRRTIRKRHVSTVLDAVFLSSSKPLIGL